MPASPRRQNAEHPSSRALAVHVGNRVRHLRDMQNVSLTKLAHDSGLAKGTLSELENGHRNPTLDTLFAITTALGTPLSSLLPSPTAAMTPADAVDGEAVSATLLYRLDSPDAAIEVYALSVSTRKQQSAPHGSGVTETLVVLEGRMEVGSADDVNVLSAGQTASFRGDLPHSYEAIEHPAAAVLVMRYPAQHSNT